MKMSKIFEEHYTIDQVEQELEDLYKERDEVEMSLKIENDAEERDYLHQELKDINKSIQYFEKKKQQMEEE